MVPRWSPGEVIAEEGCGVCFSCDSCKSVLLGNCFPRTSICEGKNPKMPIGVEPMFSEFIFAPFGLLLNRSFKLEVQWDHGGFNLKQISQCFAELWGTCLLGLTCSDLSLPICVAKCLM